MDLLEGEFTTNYYVNFQDGNEETARNGFVQLGKQYKDELNTVETNLIHTNELLTKLSNIKAPDSQIGKQISAWAFHRQNQRKYAKNHIKNIFYFYYCMKDTPSFCRTCC